MGIENIKGCCKDLVNGTCWKNYKELKDKDKKWDVWVKTGTASVITFFTTGIFTFWTFAPFTSAIAGSTTFAVSTSKSGFTNFDLSGSLFKVKECIKNWL